MRGRTKIVIFGKYCETCKHFEKGENEKPCRNCLCNPVNIDSRKPTKWEEKGK